MYNKLLQRQIQKYFNSPEDVPQNIIPLLQVISNSYDHYEKDRRMIERSIELSSDEMIELNNNLTREKDELKKMHKELKTLFESIDEVFYSVDMVAYKLIQMSVSCEKIYGYTAEEFLADSDLWQKVIHPEDKNISQQQVGELYKGKQVFNQYRIIHKNNSIRWIENKVIPTLDEKGRLIRLDGVTYDVTERKNAEIRLMESELWLRTIIDLVPHFIFAKDINGKFILGNKAVADVYGSTIENLIGKSDMDFNPNREEVNYFIQEDRKVILNGVRIQDKEEFVTDSTGARRVLSTTKIPFKVAGAKEPAVLGVSVDITVRKEAEEILKRSEARLEIKNKELERKNKELEQFAYVASHDLQEPLRTISNFSELIQKKYRSRLDNKADEYFNYIVHSAERMRVLIKDLLDYSRIGRQKDKEQVDCNSILSNTQKDLAVMVNETGASIISGPLPVIAGYPTEIKLLFQNLISNAIKFRKKDASPSLEITSEKKDNHWQFTFKDNGIGIEKKYYEKIFVIFQRLHNRNEYEGSGIGLAHCKKIVELHGGNIWLESEPGTGTAFHFTIK
jgi:PAS domain S-box-containing protein